MTKVQVPLLVTTPILMARSFQTHDPIMGSVAVSSQSRHPAGILTFSSLDNYESTANFRYESAIHGGNP